MLSFAHTVRTGNRIEFVMLGLSALGLGLSLGCENAFAVIGSALILLVMCFVSICSRFSKGGEPFDEMARLHEGVSCSVALTATLCLAGIFCIVSMLRFQAPHFAAVCCACIGFGLLVRGIAFAWLERGGLGADYQDA